LDCTEEADTYFDTLDTKVFRILIGVKNITDTNTGEKYRQYI